MEDAVNQYCENMSVLALRRACRRRPDIPSRKISEVKGGVKRNASKASLIDMLAQSLLAAPDVAKEWQRLGSASNVSVVAGDSRKAQAPVVAGGSRREGRLWKSNVLSVTSQEVPVFCNFTTSAVSSIAVLAMQAGHRVKLTFSEIFTLLARASRFISQSEGDWKQDHSAHVAFLVLSARFEWALEDAAE